ncbi:hypothetical protein [Moritella yayanosii]|uniref:Uncharacterized protein n=1 Tax=Moritella yayanosii TaxID=69539 RepID=A0A330LL50_9GAMM|nr:hypothetical protein [Moritella yayanosii]SQD77132.1 conserved protein of unknown function [Moritella yayanosii]
MLIHDCSRITKEKANISQEEDGHWVLQLYTEATEHDLEENHHLEEVGEMINEVIIEIDHCPYCGDKLLESNKPAEIGFIFSDYSTW